MARYKTQDHSSLLRPVVLSETHTLITADASYHSVTMVADNPMRNIEKLAKTDLGRQKIQ